MLELGRNARVLVVMAVGMLPVDFRLKPFLVKLLREQVAGFYDSKTKTMHLLDWLSVEAQRPVMAHELTHVAQPRCGWRTVTISFSG